jgi:hypothetical protein
MMYQSTRKNVTDFRSRGGSVLQLSMRRVHDLVAYCGLYEFEDVVADVTGADRVELLDYEAVESARRAYKLGRMMTGSRRLAMALTPRLRTPRLNGEYELFFPIFNDPFELFALAAVPDWRSRSRVAACFVCELWLHNLPEFLLELLSEFDYIFTGMQNPVAEVGRIVGKPCAYLPLAVDVLRFSPSPAPSPRIIDVCNLGRRSEVTHQAFLQLAGQRRIFYYYDTVRASGQDNKQVTFRVRDAREHRALLANVLQRCRYYVANRSRINEPESKEWEEISSRFYEGIAAGAVLLGEAPRSPAFQKQFDWTDAVVPMPFDSPNAADVLAELEGDPLRVLAIQHENVRQAALRHDWVHRLLQVFESAQLPSTPAMYERVKSLQDLAAHHEGRPSVPVRQQHRPLVTSGGRRREARAIAQALRFARPMPPRAASPGPESE